MTSSEEVAETCGSEGDNADTSGDEVAVDAIVADISADSFDEWYRERKWRQNIQEGTPYFNGPGTTKPPSKHSPSSLLQCHRKTTYKQLNAPEESADPDGIFWIGSRFEKEIALPYLREEVIGSEQYVTNSLWVDFTASTAAGDVRIKGETDPVIVDRESNPILLTEIKTRKSLKNTDSPSDRHRAQAHCYMRGLTQKYDRRVTTAIIIYGSRKNLNIKAYRVDFDPYFWGECVLDWAAKQTTYRLEEELPPPDPESDWECKFCSYRERCGEGDTHFADIGPTGFLPGYTDYPRSKVEKYLRAHDTAHLTPSLGHCYPDLAEQYGVLDWVCQACGATYAWDSIDWDGNTSDMPKCESCADEGAISPLYGPEPAEQPAEQETADEE